MTTTSIPTATPRFIALYAIGYVGSYVALITPVVTTLAIKIEELDPAGKETSLGLIAAVGALVAIVANLLTGALSDRTKSRLGRRRPWIIGGALGGVVALGITGFAPNLAVVAVGWALSQLFLNMVLAALQALLPDQVPLEQRARVSAVLGIAQQVSPVIGIGLALGVQSAGLGIANMLLIPGIVGAVLMIGLALFIRDVPHDEVGAFSLGAFIRSFSIEGGLLPLDTAQAVGVIGEFARTPRIQGAGSSQVNATRVDTALESIGSIAPVEFAAGYSLDPRVDPEPLIAEAVAVAARSDVVLLFVGLPTADESEGYDRRDLELPGVQARLIRAVAAANARTVVILTNGGVVSLEPWHDSVPAIVEAWLLGQAGGSAVADVLFGRVAPSGRLAESIPLRLQDTPSYLNFPGDGDTVRYGEGIFVGYRYYETVDVPVRYPFGHGLTYTSFGYSDLEVSRDRASVTVTNTGARAGADVVQLYISAPTGGISVPRRELRGFEKVFLESGESVRVTFELTSRAYSHWDVTSSGWLVAGGRYTVEVGRSAHDIVLSATVDLPAPRPGRLTLDSRVADFLAHPVTGPIFARAGRTGGEGGNTGMLELVSSMPMRRLMRFPGVGARMKSVGALIAVANNPVVRGVAGLFQKR